MTTPPSIHRVIDERLFFIVYQPVVELATGEVFGYEALVRSKSDDFPGPMPLIRAAAEVGRLGELGRLMRVMTLEGCPQFPLFINIRPEEFDEGWVVRPDDPIYWHDELVFLELTESAPLQSFKQCSAILTEARNRGIRLAIDDLGSGYSNLSLLAEFSPEIVKLDRELLTGLRPGDRKYRLVCQLVRLCAEMGAKVVAEGVETESELAAVMRAGVAYVQGFVFGKPATPPPLIEWPKLNHPPSDVLGAVSSPCEPTKPRLLIIESDDQPSAVSLLADFQSTHVQGPELGAERLRAEQYECVIIKCLKGVPRLDVFIDGIGGMHGGHQVPVCLAARPDHQEAMTALANFAFDGFIDLSWPKAAIAAEIRAAIRRVALGRQLAIQDDLTGLFNRRYFDELFRMEHERCKRYHRQYCVVMVDLDGLKAINEHYGHAAGGQMIRDVGGVIKAALRLSDVAFRYGGDEFLVLLVETAREGAFACAERIRQAISALVVDLNGVHVSVTASFGICAFPEKGSTAAEVLELADSALYLAKARGKNRIEFA